MKAYAVISDIHSNIYALQAVVKDANAKGITTFINLGDIFYGPIEPKKTFDYLCGLDVLTISGNQDRQIYQSTETEIASNPTMKFVLDDLGERPIEWMKSLPFDLVVNNDIYACHGTPSDDLVYLMEDVSSGTALLRSEEEIIELLGTVSSKIILCGHSHTPRILSLSSGHVIVNPGSVGLQAYADEEPFPHTIQNSTPEASYATLRREQGEDWEISLHRVGYDYGEAIKRASVRRRNDWVNCLRTGRCF
ncbi:metallophosphoesterase family protein [Vibrio agarivorans]|uniref:metallophosphoesterase family protein n=1 Tax=Vibrio agarivorans TaxID=153622 RepID=UPI0025B3E417|nr:metallophosphoesterase family protein [Vibrio agarivorans]MDN3660462.1 metallophosphoesterase family protein [Vibrio agarivorans]